MPAQDAMQDAGRTALRLAVGSVTVPVEVAATAFNILRLTEQLMEETVLTMRAARPVLEDVSRAYQAGHFDPLLRTIGQIQQSAQAFAFVVAPIEVVRDLLPPTERIVEWRPYHVVRAIAPAPSAPHDDAVETRPVSAPSRPRMGVIDRLVRRGA